MTGPLRHPPSDYLGGRFVELAGDALVSTDPAQPDRVVWQGTPAPDHADRAVAAAAEAFAAWSGLSLDERIAHLRRFQQAVRDRAEELAGLITDEMGKTLAESRFEAGAVAGKVDITLDEISMRRVRDYEVAVSETRAGYCRFKPHGVMAVIGPFNFPAHLPNGHIVPALLLGNTVVVKPSERTPGVGQMLAELMDDAGMPAGVFNVVQGAAETAVRVLGHPNVDGILFTGSWPVGRRILETNLDTPGRIVALEMGGSNPAVIMADAPLRQAVVECARAAFATTGQRCTCTRRIILHRPIADRFLPAFCQAASSLLVGPGRSEEPVFMGPLVSDAAVEAVLDFQAQRAASGGRVLVEASRLERPGHFVTPGVVEVDAFTIDTDREVFGPLAQFSVVDDLDQAIAQANATSFGLAASIFTADDAAYERFFREVRSGCINRNTGTAGASSKLPFGGLGRSGNHRPAAAFAVDYCAYPVANMVETSEQVAVPAGVHWDDAWLGAAAH